MLTICLAVLVLYAWWAPSTRLGQMMHGLGEIAGRRLARLKPLTVILFVLFVAALAALVAYAKAEGLMMALPAGADGLAMFAALDVGTYVEILAAAWLIGASGALRSALRGLRTLWRVSHGRIGPVRETRRAPRRSRLRRPRTAPCDEEGEPAGWGFATAVAA